MHQVFTAAFVVEGRIHDDPVIETGRFGGKLDEIEREHAIVNAVGCQRVCQIRLLVNTIDENATLSATSQKTSC